MSAPQAGAPTTPAGAILQGMTDPVLKIHGPDQAMTSLVLDSPHSGTRMPADFGSVRSPAELRDGEDCYVDELWLPSTASGVPLLAACFPRTYLDANRHEADIDPDLLDEPWPGPWHPSGKARIGKALVWRTLDDGRPIYHRRLGVAEVQRRIETCHRPYHATLRSLLDRAHARFGVAHHFNCHSMNAVSGLMGEGGAGVARADMVLGDRDGTTCAPEITAFVRDHLRGLGYDVRINDPFKGVELVRAFADPSRGRHSLQLEINKRLYLEPDPDPSDPVAAGAPARSAGFARLQQELRGLVDAFVATFTPARSGVCA